MLSFIAYLIATIIFFLVAHGDKVAADALWGFFFVGLGLTLSTLPAFFAGYRSRSFIP